MSFAPGSPSGVVMVLNTLALTVAGFAAIYWKSSFPVALGVLIALGLWLLQRHVQPLFAVSKEQAAKARKAQGLDLLLTVLFVFWQ